MFSELGINATISQQQNYRVFEICSVQRTIWRGTLVGSMDGHLYLIKVPELGSRESEDFSTISDKFT